MAQIYDFIIVGGGTAGCLLAHRLFHAPTKPTVLVIESGPNPEGKYLREPYHRYTPAALRPDLQHGYLSTPQEQLNNRTIPYARGKGLGGSSILNFAVYLYGAADDYNHWADLVGDESWDWEHVQGSFKAIEEYNFEAAARDYKHLANPNPEIHGKEGKVKISLPTQLEPGFQETLEALVKNGEKLNLDPNSGNPIGVSVFPASYSEDGRTTSANAHLVNPPDNLTIWTGKAVHKLIFEGTKVVGVETAGGEQALSAKEVILSAGSIDTPKVLLLNGVGPAKELEGLGITVVKDLPGVGKQFHDHVFAFLVAEVDAKHNKRYLYETDEELIREAELQWEKDRTGVFTQHNYSLWGGFLKLPGLEEFPEFKALDKKTKEFLLKDTVPSYEFCGNSILLPPGTKLPEGSGYLSTIAFLMNAQSEGSVTLSSKNPEDKPLIDVGYLKSSFDRRVMREAIRATWTKVFENPEIKPFFKKTLYGPASLSDEDIDVFMRDTASTVWHANGTAMMGKQEQNLLTCVDSDLRVHGVEGLRVADLSVCPLTTNNHTQATAYLVGQKAAEKLIAEYQL